MSAEKLRWVIEDVTDLLTLRRLHPDRCCLFCGCGDGHRDFCPYWEAMQWVRNNREQQQSRQSERSAFHVVRDFGDVDPNIHLHEWFPKANVRVCIFCRPDPPREHRLGCPWLRARVLTGQSVPIDPRLVRLFEVDPRGCSVSDIDRDDVDLSVRFTDSLWGELEYPLPLRWRGTVTLEVTLVEVQAVESDFSLTPAEFADRRTSHGVLELEEVAILPAAQEAATGIRMETTWGALEIHAASLRSQVFPVDFRQAVDMISRPGLTAVERVEAAVLWLKTQTLDVGLITEAAEALDRTPCTWGPDPYAAEFAARFLLDRGYPSVPKFFEAAHANARGSPHQEYLASTLAEFRELAKDGVF